MKGDMDMKEKNRAEEWFRAKHDELAGTARANLAAHDLEPGQEAYHLDSLHYATAEQMEAYARRASTSTGTRLWRTAASDTTRPTRIGPTRHGGTNRREPCGTRSTTFPTTASTGQASKTKTSSPFPAKGRPGTDAAA